MRECRVCGGTHLNRVIDFGDMPLAGVFPDIKGKGHEKTYPLDIWHCSRCGVLQTGVTIDSDTLFRDYRYKSSVGLSGHFDEIAGLLVERHRLTKESRVIEIGSNDGVFLLPMQKRGVEITGFEPSFNISKIAQSRGANVINDYFSDVTACHYVEEGSADMVVACNCMAHVPDLGPMVRGISYVLKAGGVVVIEVQYVRDLIDGMQYDFIYHEHCYYHSISSISTVFSREGMGLELVEHIPIHGGSVRLTFRKGSEGDRAPIEEEREAGILDFAYYERFGDKVRSHINASRQAVEELSNRGSIAGYGASGRTNILTSMCGLTPGMVDYIVDDSPERAGRFTAKTHIPIVTADKLRESPPDNLIIFAWTYADMIREKISDLDIESYVLFPEFRRLG